jgi:hypothetical protein
MYLREQPTDTLTTVKDRLDTRSETVTVSPGNIRLDHARGMITIAAEEAGVTKRDVAIELPLSVDSVEALAIHLQVPSAFHKRLPSDIRDTLFNEMFARTHDPARVKMTDTEILAVRDPSSKVIDPREFIDVAARVMSPDALVIDFRNDRDFFGFESVAPDGLDRGIGGDRKVGDITRAGLRFGQDVKQNLAPWVSRYMYRLVCTNGMEVADKAMKIDARGQSVEDVIQELEAMAQIAFAKVESDMEHFYDMRNQPVEAPERTMNRIAAEHGLSDRLRLQLIEAVPTIVPDGDGDVTMFDLVNLATNMANNPEVRQAGVRRQLERFGGAVTTFHAERCRTCSTRLN